VIVQPVLVQKLSGAYLLLSFVRVATLGQNANGEPGFEWTVRQALDCRIIGFTDGAQAINPLTTHDVEGFRRARLFTMLRHTPAAEKRIKLALA
jgi:pullulanase